MAPRALFLAAAAVALIGVASAVGPFASHATDAEMSAMWAHFKSHFKPEGYTTTREHAMRQSTFNDNWRRAVEMNNAHAATGGERVFGMSPFMDLSHVEFEKYYLTRINMSTYVHGIHALPKYKLPVDPSVGSPLASSLDWRSQGKVSAVKDQGQCGSCWAFSATETIESANAMAGKPLLELAPQQIVDCDTSDSACNGGEPSSGISYVQSAGGQELESSYPYTSGDSGAAGSCQFNSGSVAQSVSGYQSAGSSEGSMVSAMNQYGPLSIVVDASSWQSYSGGVMSTCGSDLDHAVQAVGYVNVGMSELRATWTPNSRFVAASRSLGANDPAPPANDPTPKNDPSPTPSGAYWIVRNSWASSWGDGGYIYLAYGNNMCGLASNPVYATA